MKNVSLIVGSLFILATTCISGPALAQSQPTQDPTLIPKYQDALVIPPAMPKKGTFRGKDVRHIDYYEIAVRQFQQQVLPTGMPLTTVWSYVSEGDSETFNYPAFTIETRYKRPIRIKWINGLVDENGNYLPHLLPVDQTLHWANPPGGNSGRDSRGTDPALYTGPVPIVTHLHGGHTRQESDGYPEAWYLPTANNIPEGYASTGTYYDIFKTSSPTGESWEPGGAIFDYPNAQRATTLWYHDHTLGMTRANVYAGPAGFYLIRGGPSDHVMTTSGTPAKLPSPAPGVTVRGGQRFYEIPIVIQDRSFNSDGSLFYPDSRSFFDGFTGPYVPQSDISPIWNPEFFGNTIVVNGKTWPYLEVEQRRYRFRFLNGCGSRFLILQFDYELPFWQIGADGGFLPAPVQLQQLLMAEAERADVIIDFTNVPIGTNIILQNLGPDEPFGGGVPGIDFPTADPATTGQVMEFRVVQRNGVDLSTPPDQLVLPARTPLPAENNVRQVSLNELDSEVLPEEGPLTAMLGTVDLTEDTPAGIPLKWADDITENPKAGDTEVWEMYNFTEDAHPIHIHLVQFEVVNREIFDPLVDEPGTITPPELWETGTKDTVIVYPGQITRVKAKFDIPGLFVWHCHILEHEDNEMMRSYRIGGIPAAPTNLKAYASASLIILKWTDNSTDETSFEVERANTESGPFSLVGTADANKKLFIDKGLERHTIYYYRVRAVGDNGASDYSNVISATTR